MATVTLHPTSVLTPIIDANTGGQSASTGFQMTANGGTALECLQTKSDGKYLSAVETQAAHAGNPNYGIGVYFTDDGTIPAAATIDSVEFIITHRVDGTGTGMTSTLVRWIQYIPPPDDGWDRYALKIYSPTGDLSSTTFVDYTSGVMATNPSTGVAWTRSELFSATNILDLFSGPGFGLNGPTYFVDYFALQVTYSGGTPAPTVSSITPPSGSTAGGTAVTITGTGFVATPTVTFGGSAATSVVFVSSTSLTCVTPAHAAGAVDVVVTNPDAQAGTLTNGFTYIVPIRLTQLVVEIVYDSALLVGFVVPTSTDPTTGVVTTEDNNWNTTASAVGENGNGDVVSAANQTCPTAINITSLVPYTQDIRSSTSTGPLSNTQVLANGGTDRFNALWFLFAPAFSGVYSISANSSAFDAIMSIGTGRSNELGIDYRTSAETEVTAHFTLGQTYSILVQSGTDHSADSSAVNAVLNITAEDPDPAAVEAPISSCLTQQWRLHRFDTKPRLEQGA